MLSCLDVKEDLWEEANHQEWGKDAVEMTPGTVIAVPAEVKHWNGAAKGSWFQHLTYHKDVQEGHFIRKKQLGKMFFSQEV